MKYTNFELQEFQRKTVDYGKAHDYSIYALEMGLGKSLCALVTGHETNSKMLIICPVYLMLNWKREIEKFFPEKIVSLLKHHTQFYSPWDSDIVIISYSWVDKADKLFEWADMVVVDEATYIKEMKTKRSLAIHQLIYENSIKRVLLLTGTPILNRVYEFHSLISIMNYDPKIEESPFLKNFPTYVDFANHFSYLREFEMMRGGKRIKVRQWEGYRNVDELRSYLKDCYIRFKSSDVLDLPPTQDIYVQLDDQDFPELMDAFEDFNGDDENSSVLPQIKAKAALATAPLTVEYVKGLLEQNLQVIVYTDHVEAAEFMAHKLGVKPITGKTDMGWRQRYADDFQAGNLRVLVATIGSFSTGVNLQNGFNMVFSDPPWISGLLQQAKFRIIRVGQKNRCIFHYMLGTRQSQYIYERLEGKDATIKAVV